MLNFTFEPKSQRSFFDISYLFLDLRQKSLFSFSVAEKIKFGGEKISTDFDDMLTFFVFPSLDDFSFHQNCCNHFPSFEEKNKGWPIQGSGDGFDSRAWN